MKNITVGRKSIKAWMGIRYYLHQGKPFSKLSSEKKYLYRNVEKYLGGDGKHPLKAGVDFDIYHSPECEGYVYLESLKRPVSLKFEPRNSFEVGLGVRAHATFTEELPEEETETFCFRCNFGWGDEVC